MFDYNKVTAIKKMYPAGTRIMLDHMDDIYSTIESGTTGTVKFVDDIGTIHVAWDNGHGLGLCPECDAFHIIRKDSE